MLTNADVCWLQARTGGIQPLEAGTDAASSASWSSSAAAGGPRVAQIELGDKYVVPLQWDADGLDMSQTEAACVKEGMGLLLGHLSMPNVVAVITGKECVH